jgi:hypothetical protein
MDVLVNLRMLAVGVARLHQAHPTDPHMIRSIQSYLRQSKLTRVRKRYKRTRTANPAWSDGDGRSRILRPLWDRRNEHGKSVPSSST